MTQTVNLIQIVIFSKVESVHDRRIEYDNLCKRRRLKANVESSSIKEK